MDFRTRRQLAVLAVVGTLAAGALVLILGAALPEASCRDDRKNQGEEAADCGGPCIPCVFRQRKDLEVLWVRHVRVRENTYDVAAEIHNPNVKLGAAAIEYEFKLFDTAGVAVATRRGMAFAYPGETLHLAEVGLTSGRTIQRVGLVLRDVRWVPTDMVGPDIIAGGKEHALEGEEGERRSVVRTIVVNRGVTDVPAVTVAVLVFDDSGNLLGVHRTLVDRLSAGGSQPITLTWPAVFPLPVFSLLIEARSPAALPDFSP